MSPRKMNIGGEQLDKMYKGILDRRDKEELARTFNPEARRGSRGDILGVDPSISPLNTTPLLGIPVELQHMIYSRAQPVEGLGSNSRSLPLVSRDVRSVDETAQSGASLKSEAMLLATRYPAVFRDNALTCLLYTSPSPRDRQKSRMPSSA